MKNGRNIYFESTLTASDWNKNHHGWRCSSIRLPSTKIVVRSRGHALQEDGHYQLDKHADIIRWLSPSRPPDDLLVSFEITETLSTEREVVSTRKDRDKWKNSTIVAALIGAMATVAAALISSSTSVITTSASIRKEESQLSKPPDVFQSSQTTEPEKPTTNPEETATEPEGTATEPEGAATEPEAEILGKDQALALVEGWLSEQSRVFAPPFDQEPIERLIYTDSPFYKGVVLEENSPDDLKNSNSYYSFKAHNIEYASYSSAEESPQLKVKVSGEYTFFKPSRQPRQTVYENYYVYTFKPEQNEWKIYSSTKVEK